ncbi:VPA1262 family N-terminal domain-containing protein [Burkholderia multivorans]|uniref:VPA1262 family N-terminal domain-containing protein n=1 Tax=Burkholderia multivorans TaxID=87883 RepID=UPI0005105C06|nr:VPA1262 family N-terminal domain-containing protein [Burkholderia multivorans]KGB90255.1 hypothetical protein DM81_524 [Burkholderia multivorans]MDN7866096.1 VPA1262 family N-terminal domain-containing protein [Burkholderia multivorans]
MSEQAFDDVSQWGRGVVHLVWWRAGQVRRLIFGWIELLPNGAPTPANHPFIRHTVLGAKNRFVHVARFPMAAATAMEWFMAARAGSLTLPSHPRNTTSGDGSILSDGPQLVEPPGNEWSIAEDHPFLPRMHGLVEVRGLHGDLSADVAADIDTDDFENWFKSVMFFSLREHYELKGSLLCVRYDPLVRQVQDRLCDRSADDEAEVYRVVAWPNADLDATKLVVTQRRPHGTSMPVVRPITRAGEVIKVQWAGKIDRTSSLVIGADFAIHWHTEFTAFLRQVGIRLSPVSGTDVFQLKNKEKDTVVDQFSVPRPMGKLNQINFVGESLRPDIFQVIAGVAQIRRDERSQLERYSPTWLDDEQQAAAFVRSIVGPARESVWIFDPHISSFGILRFVLASHTRSAAFEIYTSAAHLKSKPRNSGNPRVLDGVQDAINQVRDRGIDIRLHILPGGNHPMHDRFIVVDESCAWLSGNSLEAIGRRASVIVKVPLPQDIIDRLRKIREDATSLESWLKTKESKSEEKPSDDEQLQ